MKIELDTEALIAIEAIIEDSNALRGFDASPITEEPDFIRKARITGAINALIKTTAIQRGIST